jgi:hypothetical protein
MTRRSNPSDRTGGDSSRRGRLEPLALSDGSKKRISAPREAASVVSRDDASSEANARPSNRRPAGGALATVTRNLGESAIPGRRPAYLKLAGRVRYGRSDIEAYEQAGFVSREPAGGTILSGDPSDVRETVERLIQSLSS